MKVIITKDYQELSNVAAGIMSEFIINNPKGVLGLATGSTPIGMYKNLINDYQKGNTDFSLTTTFNLDEYIGLDKNHPQSYNYFMRTNLFNHINIKSENIHIPDGMAEKIDEECASYDRKISECGGIDIQILGIGNNGHIGFNEPSKVLRVGTHVTKLAPNTIKANSRFFNTIKEVPKEAITMGVGGIMKAKHILLLASGNEKAQIISKLVDGKVDTYIPASLLQIHQDVTLVVDAEAGSLLKRSNNYGNYVSVISTI